MNKCKDWLEETWEIKRAIAEQYAGKPVSKQLRDMHVSVLEEFRNRGWNYPVPVPDMKEKRAHSNKP